MCRDEEELKVKIIYLDQLMIRLGMGLGECMMRFFLSILKNK